MVIAPYNFNWLKRHLYLICRTVFSVTRVRPFIVCQNLPQFTVRIFHPLLLGSSGSSRRGFTILGAVFLLSVLDACAGPLSAPPAPHRFGVFSLCAGMLITVIAFLMAKACRRVRIAEIECERTRHRYDVIADNIDEGIIVARSGIVTYVSPRMLALMGYAREDVVGKPFARFIVGNETVLPNYREYVALSALAGVEAASLVTWERGMLPVDVRALTLKREDDGARLYIIRDASERQRIEKERARMNMFVEKNPNPIIEMTADGKVQYANEAALGQFPHIQREGGRCPFLEALSRVISGEISTVSREIAVGTKWYLQQTYYSKETASLRVYGFDVTDRKRAEESLMRSEQKYRLLFETMDQGIIYHGTDGKIISANPAAERILGMTLRYMAYKDCGVIFTGSTREDGSLIAPDDCPAMVALRQCAGVRDRVMRIVHGATGAYRWINVSAVPQFREGENAPYQAYAIINDITERRTADQALQDSEARYRCFFENSVDGILIADRKSGEILDSNLSLGVLIGCTRQELQGKKLWSMAALRGIVPDRSAFVEIQLKGYARHDRAELLARDGHIVDVEFLVSAFDVGERRVLQCTVRNISDRKKAEEQIRYLSFHDKVTGLYNRTYFDEELRRIDNGRWLPISIIMGDVNNLKLVNDAFGHREGDRLLLRIAGILRRCCRTEDIIARWGGDEFIMLLPRTDEKTAVEIARRIREECGTTKGRPVGPAIALGTATKERCDQDAYELLREAEDRMYRNKLIESRSGRNAIIASLIKTLRARSHETLQHTQRVRQIGIELGRATGLSDSQMDELALLAVLHDIGKISVPDDILMKAGMLTPKEWKAILKHPEVGYRIVKSFNALAHIADAVLAHHERWDGTGYPQGLKGNDIPLIARIFAIADSYEVMTRGRCYEKAISPEQAVQELKKYAGRQFDPGLVSLFVDKVEPLRLVVALPGERNRTPQAEEQVVSVSGTEEEHQKKEVSTYSAQK
jgi:diguanylate cyclase (GGDEF)-like protein/PAS domain S-box-containing protein